MNRIFNYRLRNEQEIWFRYGRYAHLTLSQGFGNNYGFERCRLPGSENKEMTMCGKIKPISSDNERIDTAKKCKACSKFLLLAELGE